MPKFTERTALKEVVKFAKREYSEKKPHSVRVLRVKDQVVFSKGGPIPSITVKQGQIPYYLVLLDYGDMCRVYSFKKDGILILGENIEKSSEKISILEKTTKTEFSFPN